MLFGQCVLEKLVLLNQCDDCGKYYTTSNKIDKIIEKCMDKDLVVSEAIIKCICGLKHGIGGEKDVFFPESDDKPVGCIMMYGFDPKNRTEVVPILPAVMLKETTKKDTNFSTYDNDRVIYLKPINNGVKHAKTI